MEIKIVLMRILMKCKFERSPDTKVPLNNHVGFTLKAKYGHAGPVSRRSRKVLAPGKP